MLAFILLFLFFLSLSITHTLPAFYDRDDGSSILIIIDMQTGFRASHHPQVRDHIKEVMQEFIKKEDPILFVEYKTKFEPESEFEFESKNLGETYPDLLEVVEKVKYRKYDIITKENDNGAPEIVRFFHEKGIFPKFITICGINICACIDDTVRGLNLDLKSCATIIVDAQGLSCYHAFCEKGCCIFLKRTKIDQKTIDEMATLQGVIIKD